MKALHVYSPSVLEDFTSGLPVLSDMPLSKFLCFQYLAILWSLNALTSISLKISSPSYLSLLFPWSKLTLKIPYPTLQPLPPIYPIRTSSYPTLTIFRIYWILSLTDLMSSLLCLPITPFQTPSIPQTLYPFFLLTSQNHNSG